MDWLTFLSNVITSALWPGAIAWVAWLFRNELRTKLSDLSKLKHNDTELVFEKGLEVVKQHAEQIEVLASSSSSSSESSEEFGGSSDLDDELEAIRERLIRLADAAPWAAVTEGWRLVEKRLRSLIQDRDGSHPSSGHNVVQQALELDMIGHEMYEVLDGFRRLRNTAAHAGGEAVTRGQAAEYTDWTVRILNALDNWDQRCQ